MMNNGSLRTRSKRAVSKRDAPSRSAHRQTVLSSKSSSSVAKRLCRRTVKLGLRHNMTARRSSLLSPPQSPPAARLRRLGVRQADDQHSTDSSIPDSQSNADFYNQHNDSQTESVSVERSKGDHDRGGYRHHLSNRQLKRFRNKSQNRDSSDNSQAAVVEAKSNPTSLNPMGKTRVLSCPVCHKVFLSFYGHDLHLDTHESTAIKCWHCNLRFNSNKSLLQHQRLRHNKRREAEEMAGRGFHNLIFVDFSCDKFPAISQKYCEKYSTQAACHIHDYSCPQCSKSFPCKASLQLHTSQYHYHPSKYICTLCNHDYMTKSQLDKHKQKYSDSTTKKLYLPDNKRRFLRALSLMPLCAAATQTAALRPKNPPEVNMNYYNKLRQVETLTQLVYSVSSEPHPQDESDSTHS